MTSTLVRLVLSDVDGTLLNANKELSSRAIAMVDRLREADILFALTSSRPPRGIAMFVEPLHLTTPLAAFNSAMIVEPELGIIEQRAIDDDVSSQIIALLDEHHISIWLYRGDEWYVRDLNGPHTQHEASVVDFQPLQLANFDAVCTDVAKIVGVSDDVNAMSEVQAAMQEKFGTRVGATASQSYYLDITHPLANKGSAVEYFADRFSIPTNAIATIGDAYNDISMFERSGLSIAMGNAVDEVKAAAREVTTSNDDDGFANAIERFILS
ncbi:MAG: Cof-type HAD-IIB family hydrolase [Acidimicrobiales bacterium]